MVNEQAVAYIQRPLVLNEGNAMPVARDRREPDSFMPGARLFIKESAAPSAPSRDVTSRVFRGEEFLDDDGRLRYDVRDLAVSYDGQRLLFAMHAPVTGDEEVEPTWNIWEYDLGSGSLRRIITSDIDADSAHDIAPAYLADGSIVFSSTRQRASRAILLDEGKGMFTARDDARRSPAFVLHIMTAGGDDIRQITFNQSHDLDPVVLDDGRILFSRWDNAGQTRNNGFNLYQINPDGTGLAYVFGRHSHDVDDSNLHYFRPIQTDDGDILVQARGLGNNDLSSFPSLVDINRFVEYNRTLDGATGDALAPLVPGQSRDGSASLAGSFDSVTPLFDGSSRYLISWSPCRVREVVGGSSAGQPNLPCTGERLNSDNYEVAPPLFGLWQRDVGNDTQLPIAPAREGQQISEAVLMSSRPLPTYLPPAVNSGALAEDARELVTEGLGIVHIRSVYDIDGVDTTPGGIADMANPQRTPADQRPARFLRFEKPVSIPDPDVRAVDNADFGISRAQGMREILGYVPVEPDGSVRAAVPANVAFAISVVDARGRRISPRHQNWLQLRPGETLTCNGCHTLNSEVPHGHYRADPAPANNGARTTGIEFPGTDSTLWAEMGETMAETWSRHNEVRRLSPDVAFEDQWAEASEAAPSFALRYEDLDTPAPVSASCQSRWSAFCRSVIHYETHIHPLWSKERLLLDDDGVEVDNFTCTGCHSGTDQDGALQIPAAHLDLSDGASPDEPRQFEAYRQLLTTRFEQEEVDGVLVDRQVDTGEYVRDEVGELILDDDGNPIPILERVPLPSVMSTAGALASEGFMEMFAAGGGHEDFLSDAELRLVSEWLDLGAQYYNNPFDTPEN
ncbi:hypothetical protein GCM10007071_36610 [Marinobacter zhanjiangensis]|uniref:Hydrazine synthase alpha subunit middle domain-containing protein n=1 Tax=Marinobacter zhanjiangensis TaxID=578215 RepID=A0ABQ3B9X5_9GAMM|nr:hypothetical protein GCM10007071_36610 [Marinobacter zhanjiangensis]